MPLQVFIDEIPNHQIIKIFPNIENMMFKSHLLGHVFSLENGVHAATPLFFLHAGLGDLIVYPISNSYQLVPLVL